MRAYRWPGNVRELRNVVQSGYILATDVITADCLPPELRGRAPEAAPGRRPSRAWCTVQPGTTIADAERMLIFATLRQFGGDKTRAAEVARHQPQDALQPAARLREGRAAAAEAVDDEEERGPGADVE